jgi:TM2 domain-containing membrane protein YozV
MLIKCFDLLKLGAKLHELIDTMNIQGGGIIPYCKTRWTTAFKSISDIIRLRSVLLEVGRIYKISFIIIII